MRTLFALIVLLLTALPAAAQRPQARTAQAADGVLIGRIVDADDGGGLAGASVAVWRTPPRGGDERLATGAIASTDGAFRIEGLRPGALRVEISFVGYATQSLEARLTPEAREVDLGTIALQPALGELGEIRVEAESERVEMRIDRMVYRIADDPVTSTGSASEALETLPSIDVDVDGNVSLRGVGNVAILINGRPAPVPSEMLGVYLQSLPAGAVERVEVMPNPSAAYDPEGMGGIINIVLAENTDAGLGMAITVGGDSQGGYDASLLGTYGRGPLSLSATYGLNRDVRPATGSRFRIDRLAAPDGSLSQTMDDERRRLGHLGNLSAELALSRATSLNASAQVGIRDGDDSDITTYSILDDDGGLYAYTRAVDELEDEWNASARIGLQHDFATPGSGVRSGGEERRRGGWGGRGRGDSGGGADGLGEHSLRIEGRFNQSGEDESGNALETLAAGGLVEEQRLLGTEQDREWTLAADYARPVAGARLEAGYKSDWERRENTLSSETRIDQAGGWMPDVQLGSAFDYVQTVHAGYAQLGRSFGPLGIQLGLRAEAASTSFELRDAGADLAGGDTFENDYRSLFPSAFFTYELGEARAHTFKASYSRRINRPRTFYLNPVPSTDDPLSIRVGNPFLRPEYVDAVELGYVRLVPKGSITVTPYYRRTTDVIRWITTRRDDGVTVLSFANLDTEQSWGVELIGAFTPGGVLDGLRGYASLEGYRVASEGTTETATLENDAFGWGGRLNLNWTLGNPGWGDIDAQANMRYRAPMSTEQGRIGARTYIDVAFRQKLGDRAGLTLRFRDPLGIAGFSATVDEPTLYQEFERDWGAQSIGLTFTYRLGEADDRRAGQPRGDMGGDEMGG